MRNFGVSVIIILLFPVLAFCAETPDAAKTSPATDDGGAVMTLNACYALALKQSELIGVDAERIKEAEAHFLQVFGTLLPQVSFSRTDTREVGTHAASRHKSYEQKFIFTQTLFSGFKEFAGISPSRYEKKQYENEKVRAEQLLFVDVSDAFFLLLEIREDRAVLATIKKAFEERIAELKGRVAIGRSRESEVVSTQTQLYSLEAEIESVRSQERIAQELLAFLIGQPVGTIVEPAGDITVKPESEYYPRAFSRPDVQAAHFAWKTDQKQIAIAKSGFLPTVDLESDYYTHRSSAPREDDWDVVLTIDVPIFKGTTTFGAVREASARARESKLLFDRAGRVAVQDIHDAYVNVQADRARSAVLKKALDSAELNYTLQQQDYRLSVVNNLDVLTALQNLEDIRRSFIHISYECKRFYRQLLVAAGDVTPDEYHDTV